MSAKIVSGTDRYGNDTAWVEAREVPPKLVAEAMLLSGTDAYHDEDGLGTVCITPVVDEALEGQEKFDAELAECETILAAVNSEHTYAVAWAAAWAIPVCDADGSWAGLTPVLRAGWRQCCDVYDEAMEAGL